MVYQRSEYPTWSWSYSRKQIFAECLRRYYWRYYGSHNGWEYQASQLQKDAYRLKQLGNIYTSLGQQIHNAAEELVRQVQAGEDLWDEGKVLEYVRNRMNHIYQASKYQREAFYQRPKHNPMLQEFYYNKGLSQELIDTIKERIQRVSHGLINSKTVEELKSGGCQVRQCEQFDHFCLANTKVFAIPDLVFTTKEGWVIVDWKTGAIDDSHGDQLKLYALYVIDKFSVDISDILCRVEYLNTGSSEDYQFDEADMEEINTQAKRSMADMSLFLQDKAKNIPKNISEFSLTKNSHQCLKCNFYELCQSEIEQGVEEYGKQA